MEGLAALGLASNIVQFIDFGCRCFSVGKEIYQSAEGKTPELVELGDIATTVRDLSHRLETDALPEGRIPGSLIKLAKHAHNVSIELIDKLDKTKATQAQQRKRDVPFQVMKNLWYQKNIKALATRLEQLRSQLMLELLVLIANQASSTEEQLRTEGPLLSEIDLKTTFQNSQMLQCLTALKAQVQEDLPIDKQLKLVDLRIRDVKDETVRVARRVKILNSLAFTHIADRRRNIDNAHKDTYAWILELENGQGNDAFVSWLRHRNGIFWITGKPGSGKSTLTKFLCDNGQTYKLLKDWAHQRRLMVADFYFWKTGTEYQKTQEGLLRAILYQIFLGAPELIDSITPPEPAAGDFYRPTDWTFESLFRVLKSTSSQTIESVKFCFFIDGLDEYTATTAGGYRELVTLIRGLAESENVKICVTSRPYNVFIDEFGKEENTMLQIHSLTSGDMAIYVRDHFKSHPKSEEALRLDPLYGDLVHEIVQRAQGVFLWVVLVTRSLLEGLDNDDDVSVLQARLATIPSELEVLFQTMLKTTEKVYRDDAIRIYRILLSMEGVSYPALLINLLFDPTLKQPIERTLADDSMEDRERLLARTATRVRARCKDLLQVTNSSKLFAIEQRVEFIHRTVYDFMLEYDYEADLLDGRTFHFSPLLFCTFGYTELLSFPWQRERDLIEFRNELFACTRMLDFSGSLQPSVDQFTKALDEDAQRDSRDTMTMNLIISITDDHSSVGMVQHVSDDEIEIFKRFILHANRLSLTLDDLLGRKSWNDEQLIKGVFVENGIPKIANNPSINSNNSTRTNSISKLPNRALEKQI